ncbi:MAG: AbrB/MazE/SpoVT family DNA-binding domain-containing protein [Nevskiaceae bacterium]|nr:AbrB/MazE/SpoVT family DNA-binding domain-containing protein [Nevskiaceae bacterium]
MTTQVNVTSQGRMSLPADLRRRLGLAQGGAVLLEETADGVVLRTAAQAVARAQAIARNFAGGRAGQVSVSGFLAQRKADSGE